MRTLWVVALSVLLLRGESRLLPAPYSVHAGQGRMAAGTDLRVEVEGLHEPRLDAAVERFRKRGGYGLLRVRIGSAGNAVQSLDEDESYHLEVTSTGATLTAPNPLGAMHGLETFSQLAREPAAPGGMEAVTIEDHPRYRWRGLMLDVSRHFIPVDGIHRTLEGMAAVKLNVFHWHLSDDQGFRVESRRYPRLQESGSDGLFYTRDQIREVVQYARDRGIRVVPEFDVPGHAASWLAGYPELGMGPGPFHVFRTWAGHDAVFDPAKPEVYEFLDRFLGEMATLFPDAYFHIGGDEVSTLSRGQQAEFNRKLRKILAGHAKQMDGWDEILDPALPNDVLIQSWRGAKALAETVRQGRPGILSAGYYLNLMEPSSKMYLVDPGGEPGDGPGVLGGETCLWTEFASAENLDSRIWPRAGAVAERLWSPASVRDIPDMHRRLALLDQELEELGLQHNANYRAMLRRLADSPKPGDSPGLRTLADVLEPGSLGLRRRVTPLADQTTPLDRLVDAVRPESVVAWQFSELVDRYLHSRKSEANREEINRWLRLWAANRVNHPANALLVRLATDALAGRRNRQTLEATKRPIGDLHLAVGPALVKLILAGK